MAAILVKRNYGAYKGRTWAYGPRKKRNLRQGYIPRSGRGYLRTAGFYGRYNRSSLKASSISSGELKYKDTDINSVAPTTGAIVPAGGTFVDVSVGTGPSQRIGRQIRVKSLNAYLTCTRSATVNANDTLRLIWLLDTQCNGTVPTVLDVLSTANYNSFRNMANSKRFVVLRDEEIDIASNAFDGTNFSSISKQRNFYRRLNLSIEYDATVNTGVVTTIRSNNLLLLAISMRGSTSVVGTVRVRYED